MKYLISVKELHNIIDRPNVKIIDCRYDLHNFRVGYQKFLAGHIPNAWYVHLEDDLTGEVTNQSGRYPLPTPKQFQRLLQSLGITPDTIIIAYDDVAGIFASRFWWLAQCFGHQDTYILNGGIQAYTKTFPLSRVISPAQKSLYPLKSFKQFKSYTQNDLIRSLNDDSITLVDVRANNSNNESIQLIDPFKTKKGQIIDSYNLPFYKHLDQNHYFLPKKDIIQNFAELIVKDKPLVFYSGSGLTAMHSFFALTLTRLHGTAAIYPGSWSQWIQNSSNPIQSLH